MSRYVGVDPSLTGTGVASFTPNDGAGHSYTVDVIGKPGITTEQHPGIQYEMLADLAKRIMDAVLRDNPTLVAIERPAISARHTSGGVTERGWLWHEVAGTLQRNGVPVVVVSVPILKKYVAGSGNANKSAMIEAVTRRFPHFTTKGNDNACDAVGLTMLAADLSDDDAAVMLPADQRAVLAKLVIHK